MVSYTTSSIPENPTLRKSKTLVVVPLLANRNDHSYSKESFETLFSSLANINLEREISRKTSAKSCIPKEVTLIIPNASLTPPGEWSYDETSLKSHDFNFGCQRMMFIDGIRSIHSLDRIKAFSCSENSKSSHYGEFVDLYPERGIAAVIGVLNVKDCESIQDLHRAEAELKEWTHKYTPLLYAQNYWDEAFDSPMAPKHFIQKRLFVFDSFDVGNSVDLSKATMKPGELVAFPPTENMDLHLNVVVQDLAVSTFMDLEQRIGILDGLGVEMKKENKELIDPKSLGIKDVASIVGSNTNFDVSENNDEHDEIETEGEAKEDMDLSTNGKSSKSGKGGGKIRAFRGMAANAVKALNGRNALVNDACAVLPPIEHELQTPIDTSFDEAKLTSKEIETIFKRNAARREKYAADLALLAGSAMDAYDRYTKAAEASKSAHDPLWYAAALEGIATSFVAMSDTGGHGADFYLENNFQYPNEVMSAAINIIGNVEDGKDATKVDKSKTTMPRAINALLEEAYGIYSRNVKLSSIASELLLKMAWYTADLEGLHLRCRWGEGFSGGDDRDDSEEHTMTAPINGSQKRWEMTSVSKIDLDILRKRKKLDPVLSKSASSQCQRFVDFLHRAASNSGIDSYTRACIAVRCAKLCLRGVRGPYWGDLSYRHVDKRLSLPRKAAFFTTIAAEAMSQCKLADSNACAFGFWAAASHLYSRDENKYDDTDKYAWACLRSTILHAVSLRGGSTLSEKAMERLLLLLGECSFKAKQSLKDSPPGQELFRFNRKDVLDAGEGNVDEIVLKSSFVRGKSVNSSGRGSFFSQMTPQALIEQSAWVDDVRIPCLLLPLIEPSSKVAIHSEVGEIQFMKKAPKSYHHLTKLISLNAVVTQMDFEVCFAAQRQCIDVLSNLRKSVPTISPGGPSKDATPFDNSSPVEYPLQIVSAKIIKSESHLLDKLKAAGYAGKAKGSLATFFNPFAEKSTSKLTTVVPQGEERMIMVEFSNCLAVPLNIPNCQLVFDKSKSVDIEAPPLAFTLPPKTNNFPVYFPFTVASLQKENHKYESHEVASNQNDVQPVFTFGVIGIRVSAFNRLCFMPFHYKEMSDPTSSSSHIPTAISTYKPLKRKTHGKNDGVYVGLEAVPAQPILLVSFANSPTPLEDAVTIPVHLSDGEIFSITPFRLENDFGSSGRGSLERLQIVAVGLPGLPEEILFDTDEIAKALEEEEERFSDEESENDDFDELMESDGLPPLKIKCITEGLSLASINDKSKSLGEGTILSFQIAATHDMGNKVFNGGNVRIRFRYRGPSPFSGIEIWRKREIALKIVKVKGPRISSLTFRSDLTWGSAYSDLCHALARQRKDAEIVCSIKQKKETSQNCGDHDTKNNGGVSSIVGGSNGVFMTDNKTVVLIAVANETGSTIILSNRAGVVGGFESSPMPTVKISSGVSVKIPMVIPCISNLDENGEVVDIANELIAHTALNWESEVFDVNNSTHKGKRQGRVRIPSRCLREMIQEHDSFTTRICKPPIIIELKVDDMVDNSQDFVVDAGFPLKLSMSCQVTQERNPAQMRKVSNAAMEFCCARKTSGVNSETFASENKGDYIWSGQIRKSICLGKSGSEHSSKICFLRHGDFVVSACVKIDGKTWFAPSFWDVKVRKK